MTLRRREFLNSLALGSAAVATFGPGVARAASAKFWFNTLFHGGDADAMEFIVKQITQSTGQPVDLTQGAWTEYYAQLYNSVVAGAAPQLGIVDDFRYESVAQVLYDLTDTPAGNLMDKIGITPDSFAHWDIAPIGGKPMGIPLDQNGFGIYWSKPIFREAGLDPEHFPTTREEFEKACDAIKKTGKVAYHPALSGETRYIRRAWLALLWSAGGTYIDGGKATFNTEQGRESLQYLVDMVQKRGWNKPGTNGINQFLAGDLGMLQNGTWFYLTAEKAKLDYGFAMPPKFFEKQVAWCGYHLMVIPQQGDDSAAKAKLEATAGFLKAFLPYYPTWGLMGGALPLYKAGLSDPKLTQSQTWTKQISVFEKASAAGVLVAEPRHPKITDVDLAVEPFTQEAYNGTMSVADALKNAEREVDKVLAQS